jgi:hypothetical protein
MGRVVTLSLGLLLAGGGLGYAFAQSEEATVDVVKVDPVNANPDQQDLSPGQQAAAAQAAVEEATAICAATRTSKT